LSHAEDPRTDATARGVDVDYVAGDMRALPWTEEFDAAVCWFTSYGYFADAENQRVLAEVARALRPGGRFVLELNNLAGLMRTWQASVVVEVGDDLAVDQHRFDPLTSRAVTTRTILRDGRVRRTQFTVRLFAFP
jgi:SAM-dependent methyltransferase